MKIETFLVDGGWRPWIFVKITAGDIVGWSEVTESNGSPKAILGAIEDMAPLVKTVEPERTYWDLYRATRQSRGGVIAKAIGAIENALWDIKGKELGVPVYELFGGPTRYHVPVYWSHCGTTRIRAADKVGKKKIESYKDIEDLADEVSYRGFTALKTNILVPGYGVVHPGFGKRGTVNTEDVVRLVEAFQYGGDADVIVDLNYNVGPEGILEIARATKRLLWLEWDCDDIGSMEYVRSNTYIPICSGENILGSREYSRYLSGMDIASIDVIWNGFGQAKRIADIADKPVTPHNYYSHLATFISANFCAAIQNVKMLEVDIDDVPWKDEITSIPRISFGELEIPSKPGWGCEVDEAALKEHRL